MKVTITQNDGTVYEGIATLKISPIVKPKVYKAKVGKDKLLAGVAVNYDSTGLDLYQDILNKY